MKTRLGGAAIMLSLLAGLINAGPHKLGASDVCGHCFRIALWYWENDPSMGGDEIHAWLGLCLGIHDC